MYLANKWAQGIKRHHSTYGHYEFSDYIGGCGTLFDDNCRMPEEGYLVDCSAMRYVKQVEEAPKPEEDKGHT